MAQVTLRIGMERPRLYWLRVAFPEYVRALWCLVRGRDIDFDAAVRRILSKYRVVCR